ncbi:S-adenosyl-L-methionine-dependent methyltransferase [Mycena galericulata]|nr:S-adenosyl-L-methionine-dependent methyltransferase [Mycena galericulata]
MAPITPPTSLPALRRLDGYSVADISRTLRGISELYWPRPPPLPPKLSVPTRNERIPDSGYASAVVSDDECDAEESIDDEDSDSSDSSLDELRADPLERAFAIKWITGLIGRVDVLSSDDPTVDPDDARERLLDEATALLALFSHHEEDEEFDITRSFSFRSIGTTVHIELNDAPLSNSDHTSVGLQSWGSAIVLAERLCADPPCPLRVLELGAGTGLLSIAVAKLLPHMTVVATDYHPAILANLAANLRTNFPSPVDAARVSALELDWAQPTLHAPLDAPFDVVLAADVVYHPEHARWIRGCVARVLRRPAESDAGRNEGIDRTIDDVFEQSNADDGVARLCCRDPRAPSVYSQRVCGGAPGCRGGTRGRGGVQDFRIGWLAC